MSIHEEEPEVLAAVLDIISDIAEEADNVPDDLTHTAVGVGAVTRQGGKTLLQKPREVDPDVPGGALHQVGLDVLEALLRGQEIQKPGGGRGAEGDDGMNRLYPVRQTRPEKQDSILKKNRNHTYVYTQNDKFLYHTILLVFTFSFS